MGTPLQYWNDKKEQYKTLKTYRPTHKHINVKVKEDRTRKLCYHKDDHTMCQQK